MDWPLLKRQAKRRDQVIAIDLGGRVTKAVQMRRRGERVCLVDYAVLEAPAANENVDSREVLAEHFRELHRQLGNGRLRQVTLALSVNDSLFRQLEMPLMPVADLRQTLKLNAKNYLQQDLPDFVFDCLYQAPGSVSKRDAASKSGLNGQKQKVLVGGARQQLLQDLQTSVRLAGLQTDHVIPGMLGPVNTFELTEPEAFAKDVVALVDLGFHNTAITILDGGEIILNRVVQIGGEHLTSGLAQALNISYAEAENIKVGMPTEVQPHLETLLSPLGRELRASIDFFEHQRDKTVSQVFLSGGAARSEFIVQLLQNDLIIPCKSWTPTRNLQLEINHEKVADLEQVGPQLAVALGAATATL